MVKALNKNIPSSEFNTQNRIDPVFEVSVNDIRHAEKAECLN